MVVGVEAGVGDDGGEVVGGTDDGRRWRMELMVMVVELLWW